MEVLCNCSNKIFINEEWILDDIKDFTERKIAVGKCSNCGKYHAYLSEKRINDGKIFTKKIENRFVKCVLSRETKRVIQRNYIDDTFSLNGWIYGINTEIKNNSGRITQTRQYSSDFKGNKKLVRKNYRRISVERS